MSVKITYIIDDLALGGAQRQLTELVKALARDCYDVEVIALSTEKTAYEKNLRDAGIPLTLIPQSGKWSWSTFWSLYRKLRASRPDIIHTWLFTADLYGRLAGFSAGVPHIISAMRNTIDDMPWHYRLASQILSLVTVRITVNAEAIRHGMIRELWIPEEKIRIIYNGIDLKNFPPVHLNGHYRREWNIPETALTIAMVARMSPQKDYKTFLQAARRVMKEVPEAYFVLVGDGPDRFEIESWIKKLELQQRVRLAGARRDVWELLHHVDIFVLSTHFEGCSNVIMEAMAAAKPVVASDAGGNAELVVDGETGWIVPQKNSGRLAHAILKLLKNPDEAKRMGQQGRQRIQENFTLDRTVAENDRLYREVLSQSVIPAKAGIHLDQNGFPIKVRHKEGGSVRDFWRTFGDDKSRKKGIR